MNGCEKNRDFIIRRTIAPLSADDEHNVQEHLTHCEACRIFTQRIFAIEKVEDQTLEIAPRVGLRSILLQRMHARNHQSETLVGKIQRLFTYRVALYQAAFVSLLLLLLLLAVPKFRTPHPISESQFTPTLADTMSMNIINLKQIIQIVDSQKVGLNLRQDTVLANILYTL